MVVVALLPAAGHAEVYRWTDEQGRTHYSDAVPAERGKPVLLGASARGGFVSSAPLSSECHSPRCQGERLEPQAAAAPPQPRGLDFRQYLALRNGMSEGELLGVAGQPDLLRRDEWLDAIYTYMPTPADPFTTTITLVRGRVSEIDRQRKF